MNIKIFEERLKQYSGVFSPVVPYEKGDRPLLLDFTDSNTELTDEILNNTNLFTQYINSKLQAAGAKYGIGGYNEHRTIYSRSPIFGSPSPALPEGQGVANAQPSLKQDTAMNQDSSSGELLEEAEGSYGYMWADPAYYGLLKEFALEHRKKPTKAEEVLWEAVKSKKLENYKFRRQHIIGRYIADIVCLDKRLIIEINGLIHQLPENMESDKQRTEALEAKGFKVIRFSNEQVLNEPEKTLNDILNELSARSSIKEGPNLSPPFGGQGAEPRRLHLGIDIWGKPYTKVMAPLDGIVHSFAFNNRYGDYGATIILSHQLEGLSFYTLYGHLSLNSLKNLQEGQNIKKGDVFTEFGIPFENGQWPPHLHFQIILDMQGKKGDYPGVCAYSERETYLANCPDPDLILKMMQDAKP